jgi:hypothetical protein
MMRLTSSAAACSLAELLLFAVFDVAAAAAFDVPPGVGDGLALLATAS